MADIEAIWDDLLDKDDRTSPEEYPEMVLITYDELSAIVTNAAELKDSDGGVEAQRHAAPMASVPVGETSGSDGVAAIPSEHVIQYVQQFGGRCRDCADYSGVCPHRGMPCGDSGKAIRHVLTALYHGTHHGYIHEPDHLPHREALAEFLSLWVKGADAQDCADAVLRIVRAAHPTPRTVGGGSRDPGDLGGRS